MLKRIAGYELISELGEGGMGVVYLARNRAGEHVAFKALRPHLADTQARERLSREASSLSRVRSPRVAEVLDADPWGAEPYVVTRFIDGLSLNEDVHEHGTYAENDLRELAIGIAEAIAAVHAVGVLHRDVKPGNVLIGPEGPVLIDFGLALTADEPKLTATGYLLGTPGYLAPEVLYGDPPTTATDVHSWAATVAFAAMGHGPAGKGPAMAIMDRVRRGEFDLRGVPDSLLPLIKRGLDPEPARRPRLESILAELGGTIPIAPADEPRFEYEPTRVLPAPDFPPRPAEESLAYGEESRVRAEESLAYGERSLVRAEESVSRAGRLRQSLGLLGLGIAGAGLVSAAPYVGAFLLGTAVMVLRFVSVVSERHRSRAERRGERRWYDAGASTLASPSYFVSSLGGTFTLWATTVVAAAIAVFIVAATRMPADNGLLLLGIVVAISLCWGPGSARARTVARTWTMSWAHSERTWLIVLVIGFAAYGAALLTLGFAGPSWSPWSHAPWVSTWLSDLADHLRG